jgi:hypothetical protein
LGRGGRALAAIGIVVVAGVAPAFAGGKASKDDFYFQETPDADSGRNCTGCINFSAKADGLYGKDSGDCALLSGDVCNHCYCQGWTDKNAPGAKKAGG